MAFLPLVNNIFPRVVTVKGYSRGFITEYGKNNNFLKCVKISLDQEEMFPYSLQVEQNLKQENINLDKV